LLAVALIVGMSQIAAQETKKPTHKTTAPAVAETAKPEAPAAPTTGTVVTDEGWVERCILAMVVTAVDGVAVTDADPVEKIEFEPGEHSVTGYANDEDRSPCATFSGDKPVVVPAGTHIGESTATVNVVAGKEYFLGVDVRSADQKTWKLVVWKINQTIAAVSGTL
ncbi:MAG: hypothetical protein ACREO9_01230, partial [Lysobacterales bacterium]